MKGRRCIRCNQMGTRNDTSFERCECNLDLCIEPSFEIYHTRGNFIAENNNSDENDSNSFSCIKEGIMEKVIKILILIKIYFLKFTKIHIK